MATTRWLGWRGTLRLALGLVLAGHVVTTACAADTAPVNAPASTRPAPVLQLDLTGAIGPASADYLVRGLARAEREQAQLVVLTIDTPGGLDLAMRHVIQAVLASRVPVAGFVAPQGARAASAGTYILYACHIAAMAPATHLGAATPVSIGLPGSQPEATPPGQRPAVPTPATTPPAPVRADKAASATGAGASGSGPAEHGPGDAPAPRKGAAAHDTLEAKRISDSVAYIRGLAQLRGRNVVWAERAVREAASLPANEALAEHVVDLIAADVPELLRKLDGHKLTLGERHLTLATAAAPLVLHQPDWRDRLLAAVSEPNIALLLVMLGLYGLIFEFMSPGFIAPGVIGGVALLLGAFGLQMLPINLAGLGLIVLGLAFLIAEVFVPSFGVLGLGGAIAFAFGSLMLIDSDLPGLTVSRSLVAALSASSLLVVLGLATLAARSRRRPPVSGNARLIGTTGRLLRAQGRSGWAELQGERWQVQADVDLDACLASHARVRVQGIDGLRLRVAPVDPAQAAAPSKPRDQP